jgi:hypothetical protein
VPKIKVNQITMNYEREGAGEPLVLVPYLAADHDRRAVCIHAERAAGHPKTHEFRREVNRELTGQN